MTKSIKREIQTVQFQMPADFSISQKVAPTVGDVKPGQKIRAIIGYTVVERTRSFTVLKINSFLPFPTKRKL